MLSNFLLITEILTNSTDSISARSKSYLFIQLVDLNIPKNKNTTDLRQTVTETITRLIRRNLS